MTREPSATDPERAIRKPRLGRFMATGVLEKEFMICTICHEMYTQPKILPCAHLLCRDCLVSWMKSKTDAQCPLCRSPIVEPIRSMIVIKNYDDYVDSLVTDHAMAAMVASTKLFIQTRVCYVHTSVEAMSLCLHCAIMFCVCCVEVHAKVPLTSSHKMLELSTLTLEKLMACRLEVCAVHPECTSQLYCSVHKIFICHMCSTSKHCGCPKVMCLEDLLEENKQAVESMQADLLAAEIALNEAIKMTDDQGEKLEKSFSNAFIEIDEICDKFLFSVETCRRRLKKLVSEENDKMKVAIQDQKVLLNKKRGRVTSHLLIIKRVLYRANATSLAAMVPDLKSHLSQLDMSLPSAVGTLTGMVVTFDKSELLRLEQELELVKGLRVAPSPAKRQFQNNWRFHANHGRSIKLSHNGQTAEKHGDYLGQTVMSSEPMKNDNLYEVLVDCIDDTYSGRQSLFGVFVQNPGTLTPPDYTTLLNFVIGFSRDKMYVNNVQSTCKYGVALSTIKAGSRVGVLIDKLQRLHLYVDGSDQGVGWSDVQQSCYALIEFRGFLKQVSTLPIISFT